MVKLVQKILILRFMVAYGVLSPNPQLAALELLFRFHPLPFVTELSRPNLSELPTCLLSVDPPQSGYN